MPGIIRLQRNRLHLYAQRLKTETLALWLVARHPDTPRYPRWLVQASSPMP